MKDQITRQQRLLSTSGQRSPEYWRVTFDYHRSTSSARNASARTRSSRQSKLTSRVKGLSLTAPSKGSSDSFDFCET